MPLDEADHRLGELDPQNRPMRRARRVLESKIADLERELASLKFIRDVIDDQLTRE